MVALVAVTVLFVVFCSYWLLKFWNEIRYGGMRKGLPPGTMGWPLVGQTTPFLRHGPLFMKTQSSRYGRLFKTHILGGPTVICNDGEINRYILMNEGKGMVPGYPQSLLDILGKSNIAAVHGPTHKYIRGSMVSLVGPTAIKDQLLPKIDKSVRSFLHGWGSRGGGGGGNKTNIDIQDKTNEMAFYLSFKLTFGEESNMFYERFRSAFDNMVIGTLSLPINLPWTNYHRGLQGRQTVVGILKKVIKERRENSTGSRQEDILGHLIRNGDPKYLLNDEEIMDQVITILYSSFETVSTTSMMSLKYLHDHPKALHEIRDENLAIRQRKKPEEPLDWEDYKSLKFTRAVIFETLRLATVVNGLLRKTTQDVELNEFIIPRGWRIYVYTREINYDPFIYPDPLSFNPWRWLEKNFESHNYNLIFGGGSRSCPGKELGTFKISMFLHYFVTQYRWEEVGDEEINKFPRVEAPNGLHIRVSNY